MPLEKDFHENLLSELLQEDLTTTRKTEILQQLRVANTVDHEEFTKTEKQLNTLKTQKDDLLVSNSMLFRKLGVQDLDKDSQQKEEQKTFSETVTLEDIL